MALHVAFHGVGPAAQPYLRALARRPDLELVAVCDPDQRAAEQVAANWKARTYTSPQLMLAEVHPDALWVCATGSTQAQSLELAVEKEIPFFVVPPGGSDWCRAKSLTAALADNRLVTTVGFLDRYADIFQEARQYLGTNPIPLALACWLCPPEEAGQGTAAELLWADGCQLIDALRFFAGEIARVRALPGLAGADQRGMVIQLEFAGGTVGSLVCSSFHRSESRRELELMGEGWSLTFAQGFSTLWLHEHDKSTVLRRLNDPAGEHVTAFLAAIATANPAAVTARYHDSLRTLAVCEAIRLSRAEARVVDLAEVLETAAV